MCTPEQARGDVVHDSERGHAVVHELDPRPDARERVAVAPDRERNARNDQEADVHLRIGEGGSVWARCVWACSSLVAGARKLA